MKLYQHPASPNCRKAVAVIQHLKLDVDLEMVDIMKGEHQRPEFAAINPNTKVPALVDGNVKLWESNAIMGYLASKTKTSLWPTNETRYEILRWLFWQTAHWGPAADTLVWENMFKGMVGQGGPDPKLVEEGTTKFKRFASVLNGQLESNKYVTGNDLTLADFSLASNLTYAGPGKLPLDEFTHIRRWSNTMDEIPAWRDTAPKMG